MASAFLSGSVQSSPSCRTSAWRIVISVPAGPFTASSTTPTRFWPKSTIVRPLGDVRISDGMRRSVTRIGGALGAVNVARSCSTVVTGVHAESS